MQSQQLRSACRQGASAAPRGLRQPVAVPHNIRPAAVAAPGPRRRSHHVVFAAKKAAPKGFGVPKQGEKKGIAAEQPCPCGSGGAYEACCAPLHDGASRAATPEALLRSRYTAYVAKNPDYIAETTHPDSPEYSGSRTAYIRDVKSTMRRLDPMGLTIVRQDAGATPDEAFITFRLQRRIRDPDVPRNAPETDTVVERSRFARVGGRWFYMDSTFVEEDGVTPEGGAASAKKEEEKPKKKGLLGLF
ncbi:hypothetical protein HYH02_008991 [Chlamydomonas schloesseri]|uniref:YchJ-like middle NTF2-like domain-containing protein n=1 Tax=Chlamydomonas schloesseri TaxID=2026947 RepID=A0A835WDC8_9CHLO|nr:hypothetical protein HYH02_008991 [Chlamydomonas schloesseri]|eukprot:KAG2445125.1 hypothetical protein HYH02_008991 [Chlamydomonas schloesseri]